jgi:RHH-type transcriptional regulator, proline utilization regulon repressor / proline dehydrogenase / delta 1-pyrroline-5-carboxylate dehydrogenase
MATASDLQADISQMADAEQRQRAAHRVAAGRQAATVCCPTPAVGGCWSPRLAATCPVQYRLVRAEIRPATAAGKSARNPGRSGFARPKDERMNDQAPSSTVHRLAEALADCSAAPGSDAGSLRVQQAVHLARLLQQRAASLQTPYERRQQMELDRMIQNPHDKATLVQLTDQAFRSQAPHRAVDQLIHILDVQGIPRFFSPFDRTLLKGFQSFGGYLPGVAVPMVKEKMRQETANVILPAERDMLPRHLRARWSEGVRMNVNYLGEALLGEQQARRRLKSYLQSLQIAEIEVISVKISTIYSQISPLARRHTVDTLCDRLELLYRAAAKERFTHKDGSVCAKFVYLDMEEYRDMRLTAEAFMKTLDREGLEQVQAGLALQAYLPDSFAVQQEINDWARRRIERGGAPVTLRIVKGANMEMERVEASLQGWPQAPFERKIETDANYKRMLHEAFRPDNIRAVHVGVASHNLFDVAYALILGWEQDVLANVQFEMLEGMANHQRRALFELDRNVLLYAPACRKEEFIHAIGYLVRRLDENTGPNNFLRHAFKLQVDTEEWKELEQGFRDSFAVLESLPSAARRTQDRRHPQAERDAGRDWQSFRNEPDTDFSLPQNTEWATGILRDWTHRHSDKAIDIPLVIAGEERTVDPAAKPGECRDPSRPGIVVGRYRQANEADIERAIRCAAEDPDGWRRRSMAERSQVLAGVARELRLARGELIGAALADGGKTIGESDPEVSEAVDFVEFYRRSAEYFYGARFAAHRPQGKGVAVVVSPWNFPIAIPCGGIAAALADGNNVILKPASDAVLPAYVLCQCFWRGGVPRTALQLAPCPGGGAGKRLVAHPAIAAVILTGGTSTAQSMLQARPDCPLFAETGGKNATIVTAMSDRDQAIKNVLHSAFSHSGQKCSATSLLLLEEEVYEDHEFRDALCDAVQSLPVGSAWDLSTRIGPLIRPPRGDLERGLKELEPGEAWALLPEHRGDNPHLYSPGVKWDVQPGSYTHLTEFFGPLLAVMRFRSLPEAIAIVNQTGFGLTSGLESLDDREHQLWLKGIRAGNLYLNRPTTGAITLRQPFGGMGKSAFGAGIKAGGPNYVAQFLHFHEPQIPASHDGPPNSPIDDPLLSDLVSRLAALPAGAALSPDDVRRLQLSIESYDRYAREEFRQRHDHFRLLGQDNFRLYLPIAELRIRIHPQDTAWEIAARVCAARAAGCRVTLSYLSTDNPHHEPLLELLDALTDPWAGQIEFVDEDDEELAAVIREDETQRLRYAAAERVPECVRRAAADVSLYLADTPVSSHGRLELLWYLQEQSLSVNYHRYGNLGERMKSEE